MLLIDEVDRADEAFEAFLLEVLAEWQVTIPELGTIRAQHKPHVIVTSNRTRELSDALRRRGLFLWLPYPSLEQEIDILHARLPGLADRLAQQIARVMHVLRELPLRKAPGVAESLDWAMALMSLHRDHLDAATLERTLGCVLKVHEDHAILHEHRTALDPDSGGHARRDRTWRPQPRDRLRDRLGLDPAPLMYPFGSLPVNLIAFGRFLHREHGFRIGPGELHDAARALEVVELADQRAVRNALRPILSMTLDQARVFDRAFAAFFFPGPAGVPQTALHRARREREPEAGERDERLDARDRRRPPPATEAEGPAPAGAPIASVAATESDLAPALLARGSYSPLSPEAEGEAPELPRVEPEWRDAARSLVRHVQLGLSRRWRPAFTRAALRSATNVESQPSNRWRGARAAVAPPSDGARRDSCCSSTAAAR